MAGRAHGALLSCIEADGRLLYLGVGVLVEVGDRADGCGVGSPRRAPSVDLVGAERAVLITGNLDFAVGRRSVAGSREFVGAIEHELHWRAGFLGEFGGDLSLNVRAELTAKPAAHVMSDALHFG